MFQVHLLQEGKRALGQTSCITCYATTKLGSMVCNLVFLPFKQDFQSHTKRYFSWFLNLFQPQFSLAVRVIPLSSTFGDDDLCCVCRRSH